MSASVFQRFGFEVAEFLRPLERALCDPDGLVGLLRYLGAPVPVLPPDIATAARDLSEARAALLALTNTTRESAGEDIEAAIEATWSAIDSVTAALQTEIEIDEDLPGQTAEALGKVPHWLAVRWLEARLPSALLGLRGIGVVDHDGERSLEVFHQERLEAFLDDPAGAIATLYAWGEGTDWEADRLLAALDLTGVALGRVPRWGGIPESWVDAGLVDGDRAGFDDLSTLRFPLVGFKSSDGRVVDEAGLLLGPLGPSPTAPLDGLFLSVWSTFDTSDLTAGGFAFEVPVDLEAPAVGVLFRPTGISAVAALPSTLTVGARQVTPIDLGKELLIEDLRASLDIPTTGDDLRIEVGGGFTWSFDLGAGDAFVADVVGSTTVEGNLAVAWSQSTGITVDLAAGVEVYVEPAPLPGPVSVDALRLRLWVTAEEVTGHALVDVSVRLGIVSFTIGETGLEVAVPLAYPIEPVVTFLAPRGVGIAIGDEDTVVQGGGYLELDPPRYSGAIALSFAEVGITAIGLIDVDDGWSLVVSLAVNLPPILLPFGFLLSGIGGILAWDRRVDVDVLRDGLVTGALDALLFPDDPVGQAPQLLRDLDLAFPRAEGQLTFGPVVQITWGVPTLFDIQLGVLVALPEPVEIVIIGQFRAVLPDGDTPILSLKVDLLGHVDLGAGTIEVDAELHDSWVAGLSLAGSMALRMSYGEDPGFLLSFGGFHPAFQPPADLASMRRLTIGVDLGNAIEITAEAYFAITSNTVQFGARVDLYAELLVCKVTGGVGFDVLIQVSPFGFDASVDFYCSLEAFAWELAAVRLEGHVKGPEPWSVLGKATIKVLGVKTKIRVDATLPSGASKPKIPIETVDVAQEIRDVLADPASWRPSTVRQGTVQLRGGLGDDTIPPDAAVEVVQGVAPLGLKLERFGEYEPKDPGPFTMDDPEFAMGPAVGAVEDLEDWFAPAVFTKMGADARLGAPSFEKLRAGIRFGDDGPDAEVDDQRSLMTDYEEIVWDPLVDEEPVRDRGPHRLDVLPGRVVLVAAQPVKVVDPAWEVRDAFSGAVIAASLPTHAEARQLAPAGTVIARKGAP